MELAITTLLGVVAGSLLSECSARSRERREANRRRRDRQRDALNELKAALLLFKRFVLERLGDEPFASVAGELAQDELWRQVAKVDNSQVKESTLMVIRGADELWRMMSNKGGGMDSMFTPRFDDAMKSVQAARAALD